MGKFALARLLRAELSREGVSGGVDHLVIHCLRVTSHPKAAAVKNMIRL